MVVLHVPYMYSYPYTCIYPLCQSIHVYYSNGGITCTVHVLIPIYTPCVRVSMYTIVTVVLHVPYMYRTYTHTHIYVCSHYMYIDMYIHNISRL